MATTNQNNVDPQIVSGSLSHDCVGAALEDGTIHKSHYLNDSIHNISIALNLKFESPKPMSHSKRNGKIAIIVVFIICLAFVLTYCIFL